MCYDEAIKQKGMVLSMNKLLRTLSLLLAMLLLFAAATAEEPADEDPVLATLGDRAITLSDAQYFAALAANYGYIEDPNDLQAAFPYAVQDLLYQKVVKEKVTEAGIENLLGSDYDAKVAEAAAAYQDEIDAYVSAYCADLSDAAAVNAARQEAVALFEGMGYSEEAYVNENLEYAAFDVILAGIEVTVTEEEIQATYNESADYYASMFADNVQMYEYYTAYYGMSVPYCPEGYRGITHILLMADEELLTAVEEAEDDEAKTKAEQAILDSLQDKIDTIYTRIDAGESFEKLIAEFGEDPGMTNEENLAQGYAVHADSIIYDAAFTAGSFSEKMQKPGDVSDPIVSGFGVHILYYLRDVPAGVQPMSEEERESITEYLMENGRNNALNEWMSAYEDQVTYTDAYATYIG